MEELRHEEKIFFIPGNIVTLKHNIDNVPMMLVTEVVTSRILTNHSYWGDLSPESKPHFKGIRCIWFTKNNELQEHIFSTKDLIKL